MLRFTFPINKEVNIALFTKCFLSSFKTNLLNSIDINKFNLRYDYLVNNEILVFTNSFRIPSKKLINLMGHLQAAKDSKLLNFGSFVMLNNAVEKKHN